MLTLQTILGVNCAVTRGQRTVSTYPAYYRSLLLERVQLNYSSVKEASEVVAFAPSTGNSLNLSANVAVFVS